MITSIVFFIYCTLGFGLILDFFSQWHKKDSLIERMIIRIGLGIALFSVLGIILDLINIPIHFSIYIFIATIIYGFFIFRYKKELFNIQSLKKNILKNQKNNIIFLIVFILFLVTSYMYIGGAYQYGYMENGDPWHYATVSKVISEEGTFKTDYKYDHYAEPYTQGYQILIGVVHQTNDSIYDTMKFFTNLIISFSLFLFFFFVKELFNNHKDNLEIALLSTIILFSIPSWLSHFMFSLALNMALLPLLLYCLIKIDFNKSWMWAFGLVYASILVNHFFTAFVITGFIIFYIILKIFVGAKIPKTEITGALGGFLLSLIYFIPSNIRHYSTYLTQYTRQSHGGLEQILIPLLNFWNSLSGILLTALAVFILIYGYSKRVVVEKHLKKILKDKQRTANIFLTIYVITVGFLLLPFKFLEVKGSADRVYSFSDFFEASAANLINNPIGWGEVITIFAILGSLLIFWKGRSLFTEKEFALFFSVNSFILFLILIFGKSLSISVMPFRMWTFTALFVSIICGYAIYRLFDYILNVEFSTTNMNKIYAYVGVLLILGFIISTSFIPKYEFNNSSWPDEELVIPDIQNFYEQVRLQFPSDTKMISVCRDSDYLVSYNMVPVIADKDFNSEYRFENQPIKFYERFYDVTVKEIHSFALEKDVDYITMGVSCEINNIRRNPENQSNILANLTERMNYILEERENRFDIVANTPVEIILKVNK